MGSTACMTRQRCATSTHLAVVGVHWVHRICEVPPQFQCGDCGCQKLQLVVQIDHSNRPGPDGLETGVTSLTCENQDSCSVQTWQGLCALYDGIVALLGTCNDHPACALAIACAPSSVSPLTSRLQGSMTESPGDFYVMAEAAKNPLRTEGGHILALNNDARG